jgi:hypothetical protein
MTYEQLMGMVLASSPGEWIYNDERGLWVFTKDLDIRITAKKQRAARTFVEPWAQNFPDRRAYLCVFELWYHATLVKEYAFVAVDGYRAYLPIPKAFDDMTITKEQYLVAGILNMPHGGPRSSYFDDYITRFRID